MAGMAALAIMPAGLLAEEDAWYLDIQGAHCGAVVEINGFPLYEAPDQDAIGASLIATPWLRNGKNEISVVMDAREGAEAGWVEIAVATCPIGEKVRSQENETIRFQHRYEPVRSLNLQRLPEGSLEVLAGSAGAGSPPFGFEKKSPRRWAFGASVKDDKGGGLGGKPVRLTYAGLSQTLAMAELHLVRRDRPEHLVFAGLKLAKGDGEIELAPEMIKRGRQWREGADFDSVWLFGFSADGVEEVGAGVLSLGISSGEERFTREIEAEIPHRWSWEDGADVREALKRPEGRDALVARLKELHGIVANSPAESWSPHFEAKLKDMARTFGRDEEEMRKEQIAFFSSLTGIAGWALEPFDEKRLLLVPVNDRVVKAAYVDSPGPIESVPLPQPGSGKLDRFSMPLYVSLIDGIWTVVR